MALNDVNKTINGTPITNEEVGSSSRSPNSIKIINSYASNVTDDDDFYTNK